MEDGRVRSTMARAIQVATNQWVHILSEKTSATLTIQCLWIGSRQKVGENHTNVKGLEHILWSAERE
jgi:hypothetical protein